MAVDKALIGQVKQACLNAKKAGVDISLEKVAGPFFRNRRPVQQYQPPVRYQQPAQAPAPTPAQAPFDPYGKGPLPSEDTAASKADWQQAPEGMQRFRHSHTGEVFYAPDQNAASAYVAGGDAASLGIKPGQRVPTPQAVTPSEYKSHQEQQMAASRAKVPAGPSGMDRAIEQAKKIRAQMQAEEAAKRAPKPPAPQADSPSTILNPQMTPLTQGANRPVMGSMGQPNLLNMLKNTGTVGYNTTGNMFKAVGSTGPGVGMPGPYNKNAPGNPAFSASPSDSIGKTIKNVGESLIPSNAGSLNVPPAKARNGRNY